MSRSLSHCPLLRFTAYFLGSGAPSTPLNVLEEFRKTAMQFAN
jgi:hypothetical protein